MRILHNTTADHIQPIPCPARTIAQPHTVRDLTDDPRGIGVIVSLLVVLGTGAVGRPATACAG